MPDKNINRIEEKADLHESEKFDQEQSEKIDLVDSNVTEALEGIDDELVLEDGRVSEVASKKKDGDMKAVSTKRKLIRKTKPKPRPLPGANVMISRVVKQVFNQEVKELPKFENDPFHYAVQVKKIRTLRKVILDMYIQGVEYIKEVYLKYFGEKHGVKKNEDN